MNLPDLYFARCFILVRLGYLGLPVMAVRWGILGCAGIAVKFCASVGRTDKAVVSAVASRSLEKAEQFINDHCPGAKAYGSYQDPDE